MYKKDETSYTSFFPEYNRLLPDLPAYHGTLYMCIYSASACGETNADADIFMTDTTIL
jgi:hypothetical protein